MRALEVWAAEPGVLVALPLGGFCVNVAAQWIISRLPLGIGQIRRQFLSFGFGLLFTVIGLSWALLHRNLGLLDLVGYFILHLLSYVFLGFCFFNLINLNVSSLRIRMLKEYDRLYPQPLSDHALMAKYRVSDMLDARLERLESGGQIRRQENRYISCGGIVTLIGYFFSALRRFLLPVDHA